MHFSISLFAGYEYLSRLPNTFLQWFDYESNTKVNKISVVSYFMIPDLFIYFDTAQILH